MTRRNKVLLKFLKNPQTFKLKDIKLILLYAGFKPIQAKGSHLKFIHSTTKRQIIISVHKNDCKKYYKKIIAKILTKYLILILWNHSIIQLHSIIKGISMQ